MSDHSVLGSGARIGIAIGQEHVWAVDTRAVGSAGSRVNWWSRPVQPLGDGVTQWPDLEAVLAELHKTRRAHGSLSIALLPPLAQVRVLDLPPLDAESALRLVARNAARYFIGVTEPHIVNLSGGGEGRGDAVPVAGAAAPARVVDAIYRAATGAGWTVTTIAPSYEAWIAGAGRIWPSVGRGHAQIVILGEDYSDVVSARNGSLALVRQFRDAGIDAEHIAAALAEHPERLNGAARQPVAALGPAPSRALVAERLRGSGLTLAAVDPRWTTVADSPEHMAAAFAPLGGALALLPEEALARHRARGQRLARWCAVAAVVLAVLSAALLLWGAERDLQAVRAQRAAIAAGVRTVAQSRDSIARLTRRVTTLRQIQDGAPPWSAIIGQLAAHLPPDAYLATLRAQGDSITLTGFAQSAVPTIEELKRTPGLSHMALFGQIRRDAVLGGKTAEQFSVRAWIPPVAAVGSGVADAQTPSRSPTGNPGNAP